MSVHYAQDLSIDMLVAEIEALLDWHGHLLRYCFFPDGGDLPVEADAPDEFLLWCQAEESGSKPDKPVVERLAAAHADLCLAAKSMLELCDSGSQPTLEFYDAFEDRFDGFITQIQRLFQDTTNVGTAVDAVTGLRTESGLKNDLKREQDRFDRKGTTYSIAHIGIDNMAVLEEKLDRHGMDAVHVGVAQAVARIIRSFDDAYFLGEGEYLITLKHIDFMDACVVMDRLRGEISRATIKTEEGEGVEITASLGIAEAIQNDTVDVNLLNAKNALKLARNNGGNRVQEYRETSALERYAKNKGGFPATEE